MRRNTLTEAEAAEALRRGPSPDPPRDRRPGLGDLVAATTEALGVPPCPPCMARKEALNEATPGIVRRVLAWIARR